MSRGLTLIEVMVATTVTMMLLLAVGAAVDQNAQAARFDLASSDAQGATRKALNRITRELIDAGGDELGNEYLTSHPWQDPATGTAITGSTLTFRVRTGLDSVTALTAANNWSAPITYRLQPASGEDATNGVDDDGDGFTDEQALVRVQSGDTVILEENVVAFVVTRDPTTMGQDDVRVTLTVGRSFLEGGVRRTQTNTGTTTVLIRNRVQAP